MKWRKAIPDEWTVVGAAVPETESAVDALDGGAELSLGAADPSFSAGAFTTWSGTVFDRAVKAWQTGNPESLHPVMQDAVWNHYAQWLLFIRGIPIIRTIMGRAQATATFVGAVAEAGYHSAMVEFSVQTQAPAGSAFEVPADDARWRERWLFQRPAGCHTHASGAVAVCEVCGAPVEPEEMGKCRYCHADITTRTAGWLVTRTATTMRGAKRFEQRLSGPPTGAGSPESPPQPPRAGPLQPPRAGPA
jgi:hypothetical protein